MKSIKNILALLTMVLVGLSLTACSNDDLDTNQYMGGVSLNAYGPNPVMRGGQLRFVGSNLDQVASIAIPGVGAITNFETVKAGVPSEIRVTVPKDGPTVGRVVLTANNGQTFETRTDLTYIESIEVTGFTPAQAMPGDIIKIEGDYLNLILSMAFADGVMVSQSEFKSQDRYYIEVRVPEEAKTGKLELYTADLSVEQTEELEYQTIITDEALIVGTPIVTKLKGRVEAEAQGNIVAKAGEKVSISGSYFNVVADVTVGGVSVKDMAMAEDGSALVFTLPAEAPDGDIVLVCKSGVEVPAGTLTTVKPSECKATPNPVKAGQQLTINGQDMNVVVDVVFADSKGEYTLANNINIINTTDAYCVEVPEKACEGNLQLVMANGERVEVPFTLVKPVVTAYSVNPASAGSPMQVTGTDLDLVKSITFGEANNDDDKLEVSADGKTLTVTVPMAGTSGKPMFNLANGTSVEGLDLAINEAVFCYFAELPGENAELKAGESMMLPVVNADKLTGVQINGEECHYVLANGQLIIGIPSTAKKGSSVRLVSSNGEITYTIDFIPNTEVTTVLWTGEAVADDWKDQPYVLSDAGQELKDAGVVAGDIISFHLVALEAAWKIQFVEGHWGPTYASICSIGNDTESGKFTEYDLDANKGYFNLVVTQEMLDAAFVQQWWGGVFVLNGDNVVVDKITTTHYNSMETTLWTGEAVADDWGNQPYILSDGGTELLEAGLKVGSVIRCYLTATDATWNCQIVDGHWNPNTPFPECDFSSGNWNLEEHNGALEFTVTDYMYEHMTTVGGWGGSFLLNGDNVICTKVTIE